ncbi:MAG: hypothetical protein HQM02_10195 [Magnetococcales bacterium]|nr:hypothetical protein [Magnetococcales bacterium]
MKKSILLGAAALAAISLAGPSAEAGEVKIGGYYMFRVSNADDNITDESFSGGRQNADDMNLWSHRLQLNLDMKASEKSHAHMRVRVIDSQTVSGADVGTRTGLLSADNDANGPGGIAAQVGATGRDANWDIRQMWLETEAWGVGVKVGEMPLAMNDNILINNDTTAFGTIMLSKTFGDVTVVGAAVKVNEGNIGGGTTLAVPDTDGQTKGANKDDVDLYALSVLGKVSNINYQATLAYLTASSNSAVANAFASSPGGSLHDWWLALTLNTAISGIELTGTLIYEAGMDGITNNMRSRNYTTAGKQLEGDDFLVALRAKGKTGFGGWNAYAFYAGSDFTNISNTTPEWSPTWDQSGPNGRDLMNLAMGAGNSANLAPAGTGIGVGNGWGAGPAAGAATSSNYGLSSPTENMWGIGAGLTINAGGWTIRPMLDYAHTAREDLDSTYKGNNPYSAGSDEVLVRSAWGGSLILSTPIQQDTVLSLTGQWVDPSFTAQGRRMLCATNNCENSMHQLMADIKMTF